MSNLVTSLLDRKNGGACPICNEVHPVQNRCRYEALASKIAKLTEANGFIPQILAANKEATELAKHFQGLVRQADEANTILMEVLEKHGEIGLIIRTEYFEKLDSWAAKNAVKEYDDKWGKKSTNQDTSEHLPLFNQENSTQKESEDKLSIMTESGETSQQDS